MHILLVDDNPADRELIRRTLLKEFPEAVFTEIVRERDLMEALERGDFDLVLTDYRLHWSDGLKVLDQVRQRYPYCPVIMVTETGSEEVAVAGMHAGLSDYVLKRHMRRLPLAIRRCLEEMQLRRERDEVVRRLQVSEARYRELFEQIPIGLYITTPQGDILDANPAMVSMLGFPDLDSLRRVRVYDLFARPEERAREQALLYRDGIVQGFEVELRRYDGSTIWARDHCRAIYDEIGQVVRYEGALEDITWHKQAEEEQHQHWARIHLLNQITRAIAERQDLYSVFRAVLRRLESDLPVSCSCIGLWDRVTNAFTVVAHGPLSEKCLGPFLPIGAIIPVMETGLQNVFQGQTVSVPDTRKISLPVTQKLAETGILSVVAVPLMVEDQPIGVMVVGRQEVEGFRTAEAEFLHTLAEHVALAAHQTRLYQDLQQAYNELRRTQRAVMEQERLRAMGQMASGIAHDINNAVSPIVLYARLIASNAQMDPQTREWARLILLATEDVANTVKRLQNFYRPRGEEPFKPMDLNRIVEEAIALTRPYWRDIPQERGATIQVERALDESLPTIAGLESELREALVNLIVNAVDAMPEGGTLTVRTAHAEPQRGFPGTAILEVSDTGVGMDEKTRERCLEPFFTTKEGRGSGLGLSIVYGVVQRHEGRIEIESAPGRGTTVRLLLPIQETKGEVEEEAAEVPLRPLRILFIDDEPLLRDAMREWLMEQGHTVEVADGGKTGLDAFERALERGEPFEIVITDLGMPYLDGREVARRVKARSPHTPVILLTGWGVRLEDERIPASVDYVMSKPPRLQELQRAMRRLVSSQPSHLPAA